MPGAKIGGRNKPVATKVVVALIYDAARLLVCQRAENGPFPLKWELPGGKVEPGEGYKTALQRELREELAIEILSAREIFRHRHRYSDQIEVELIFFRVEGYRGAILNRAFHRLLWVEVPRLKELDFLEGDLPLIDKLICGELCS